jgi:hypothetical protein
MKKIKFIASFIIVMLFVGANNAFAQVENNGAQEEYMGVIGKDLYISLGGNRTISLFTYISIPLILSCELIQNVDTQIFYF